MDGSGGGTGSDASFILPSSSVLPLPSLSAPLTSLAPLALSLPGRVWRERHANRRIADGGGQRDLQWQTQKATVRLMLLMLML